MQIPIIFEPSNEHLVYCFLFVFGEGSSMHDFLVYLLILTVRVESETEINE